MADVSVKVGVDNSSVSAGLAAVRNSVDEFKKSASESFKDLGKDFAGVFAAGAIIESLKGIGEQMERVQKLAIRFGESAESIQRVGQAADQNGTDLETVAKAMSKVNTSAVQAEEGNKGLAQAFDELGINARSFSELPLEEKLLQLSEGYEKAQGSAEKMAAVQKVLGRGSLDLIPLLAQGSAALQNQFDSASVVANEDVQKIAEATEELTKDFDKLKVFGADALAAITDAATRAGNATAVIWAYVSNLPHGFRAAKEAANEALDAIKEIRAEEAEKANTVAPKTVGNEEEGKAVEESKSEEKEIARLQQENADKQKQAHLESLSLTQRELELKKELYQIDRDINLRKLENDQVGALELEGKKIDLQKELEENGKKQDEDSKRRIKELEELHIRAAKETARSAADAKKEELEKAEKTLSELEKSHSFSVDSLRAQGGGIVGANYAGIGKQEDMVRKGIELQKQTVEQLKEVVKRLEDKSKNFDNTGAFTL